LATWFDDVKNCAWDEQMEADAAAGKLDFLFEEAEAERAKGTRHCTSSNSPDSAAGFLVCRPAGPSLACAL